MEKPITEIDYSMYYKTQPIFIGGLVRKYTIWDTITIFGSFEKKPKHVFISLLKRTNEESTFLRFALFIEDEITTRSCQVDNKWSEDEIEQNVINPINWHYLKMENSFEVTFAASDKKFYIAVSKDAYCTYEYRDSFNDIDAIEIRGDVTAIRQFDHRTIFPLVWPKMHSLNPRDVFSNDMPIKYSPGHVITMTAVPKGNPRGHFIIYFTAGTSKKEAFHFNARFEPQLVVVRNAMNPTFELKNEQRHEKFPFKLDEKFRIAIGFTEKEFLVAVNGEQFTTFHYIDSKLLNVLGGLKIRTRLEMDIRILSIEHIQLLDKQCQGYEKFSDQKYAI